MSYSTLSGAIKELQSRGYTENIYLNNNALECKTQNQNLYPSDFSVDEIYSFERDLGPDDPSVLFAISTEKYAFKGVLIDSQLVSSDLLSTDILQKLKASSSQYKENLVLH